MLLGTDADELDIILRMQGLDCGLGLGRELSDQGTILNCVVLTHCASDRDAPRIDNDNSLK